MSHKNKCCASILKIKKSVLDFEKTNLLKRVGYLIWAHLGEPWLLHNGNHWRHGQEEDKKTVDGVC